MSFSLLRDRFRGAMVGAVIGDCLGAPVEFITNGSIPISKLSKVFTKYDDPACTRTYEYTDDTAMARKLADSIIESKTEVEPKDMAKRFVDEFFSEPNRGYGGGVVSVFQKLHGAIYPGARSHKSPNRSRQASRSRSSSPDELRANRARSVADFDPFLPAKAQFDGSGSYGNGASMRVHPMALFGFEMAPSRLAGEVRKTAEITHANESGVQGAMLQAYAVQLSLHSPEKDFSEESFLGSLQKFANETFDESKCVEKEDTYAHSLDLIGEKLKQEDLAPAYVLGNDVSAHQSVPSAIFSFLRAQRPVEELGVDDEGGVFKRTLMVAFSFGGDADTIGSMAGAIAGARVGLSGIPKVYVDKCEGTEDAIKQADRIFDNLFGEKKSNGDDDDKKNCCCNIL